MPVLAAFVYAKVPSGRIRNIQIESPPLLML